MKKIQKLRQTRVVANLMMIFCVLFTLSASCGKEKDKEPEPNESGDVVGRWRLTAMTVSPAIDGETDQLAAINKAYGNDCNSTMISIFKKDGTIDEELPKGCEDSGLDYDDTATWKVKGKKIFVTNAGMSSEFDLVVTKNTMTWTVTSIDPTDPRGNGTFVLTYTRV